MTSIYDMRCTTKVLYVDSRYSLRKLKYGTAGAEIGFASENILAIKRFNVHLSHRYLESEYNAENVFKAQVNECGILFRDLHVAVASHRETLEVETKPAAQERGNNRIAQLLK